MSLQFSTPPKSICILRLSAIGDVTHVLPILRTIQNKWPTTKITWIIGMAEAALVSKIKNVEFIIFDKKDTRSAYKSLYKALAGRHFDILLNMQVALRANIASLMIRADIKVGFDKKRSRNFQHWFTNTRISGDTRVHVIDTFFQFLETLGIEERILKWNIPLSDNDVRFSQQILKGRPTLVINPCTSVRANNWRNWKIERYAEVIDYAANNYGLNIVLTGGPSKTECCFGDAITEITKTPVTNLIGETTLRQLQAILASARVVIAPDTGPAHMAAASGVPVIGLYASSNPNRTGPYNSLSWVVNKYPEALQQYNQQNVENAAWGKRVRAAEVMDTVSVKDVTDMLDNVLYDTANITQRKINP